MAAGTYALAAALLGAAGCSQNDLPCCNAPASQVATVTFSCGAPPASVQVSGSGCQDGAVSIASGKAIISPVAAGTCHVVVDFGRGAPWTQDITVTEQDPASYCAYFVLSETSLVATCSADAGGDAAAD